MGELHPDVADTYSLGDRTYIGHGLDADGQCEGAVVYHAGTKQSDGKYLTAGGRVLGVTCTGDTLELALEAAYKAVKNISFTDTHYRHDIGKKALSPEKF